MKLTFDQIIAIAQALESYVQPVEAAVVAVVKALTNPAADDAAADADLRQLVTDALEAKAEADAPDTPAV